MNMDHTGRPLRVTVVEGGERNHTFPTVKTIRLVRGAEQSQSRVTHLRKHEDRSCPHVRWPLIVTTRFMEGNNVDDENT